MLRRVPPRFRRPKQLLAREVNAADVFGRPSAAQIEAGLLEIVGPEYSGRRVRDWVRNRKTQEAHRVALHRFIESVGNYPHDRSGRGVILIGGGPKYAIGLYVHVRMLRELGCDLPVQIWHRGSVEPIPECVRMLPGVSIVDADRHALRPTWRTYGGWQLKLIAGLNSGWREWIFSDADNYPVANPELCFNANPTGAVLWPDIAPNDGGVKWKSYGVKPPRDNNGTNGGSAVFDLSRCWKALQVAHWLDMHSDYFYRVEYRVGGFGDQDQVRAAFHLTNTAYTLYNKRPDNRAGIFVQNGLDGRAMWVHRIHDKQFQRRDGSIPLEARVHEIANEFRTLTSLPAMAA